MLHLQYIPGPPLDSVVDHLWLFAYSPEHARERILPTGTAELVINLEADESRSYGGTQPVLLPRFSGAMVAGPFQTFFDFDTRKNVTVMGVHFKPGGAFPFFGCQSSDLANSHVDLDALWGVDARRLRERLYDAHDPGLRFQILENTLMEHVSRPVGICEVVNYAVQSLGNGDTPVSAVVRALGMSHRRFIEVFTSHVGITPKAYGRIRRFQRAITLAKRTAAPDWGRLAIECGFYDQAHMIRDFQAFSGITPTRHLDGRHQRLHDNHVAP